MTTRGPSTPGRRGSAPRIPARAAAGNRRVAASGAVRRDGRSSPVRARPNRAATPRQALRRSGTSAASAVGLSKSGRTGVAGRRLTVTTRAALLALTLCLVALTMAYPLRAYLTQRSTISDLTAQQREDQQAVTDLRNTVARYQDPASVQDEARRRLHYQLPGEKVYLLPPGAPPVDSSGQKVHTPALPGNEDQPWYAQLWGSAVETSK
jgi:cell division protein FtsB